MNLIIFAIFSFVIAVAAFWIGSYWKNSISKLILYIVMVIMIYVTVFSAINGILQIQADETRKWLPVDTAIEVQINYVNMDNIARNDMSVSTRTLLELKDKTLKVEMIRQNENDISCIVYQNNGEVKIIDSTVISIGQNIKPK